MDWTQGPRRPLTSEDVWLFLQEGLNEAEIAVAGGVSLDVARGMVRRATTRMAPITCAVRQRSILTARCRFARAASPLSVPTTKRTA